MHWVFRLLYLIIRLVLKAVVQLVIELVRCAAQLLTWSVRTYGWGRVGSFLLACWASLWIHHSIGRLSLSSVSLGSVAIVTMGLWGGLIASSRLVTKQWHHRLETLRPPLSQARASTSLRLASLQSEVAGVETAAVLRGVEPGATPLWNEMTNLTTLQAAWQRVLKGGGGPGPDGVTIEGFTLDTERQLRQVAMELDGGSYHPRPPRMVEVPKRHGGTRRLAVLCVRDRIIQQALHLTLVPLWDKQFAPCSYAYRPGRSALQAVHAVERALTVGRVWVVDADIEAFFDRVPHQPLFTLLDDWLPDPRVRGLIEMCVQAGSPEDARGLAQGAPLSPLLANLYLHRFDAALLEAGHTLVRYADDVVIPCATRQQADTALQAATRLLHALALSLNPDKTRIVHRDEGFTFLGYLFTKDGKRPSEEAMESLSARLADTADEETRHQVLTGWQGYFGEAPTMAPQQQNPRPEIPVTNSAGPAEPWWTPSEENDKPAPSVRDDGPDLTLYRMRFVGRSDVFARYWQREDRKGCVPVRRGPTDHDLQAHLGGQECLGTYLMQTDGTTNAVVLDVDGPAAGNEGQARALPVARRLVDALRQNGTTPVWMDSGGKGFHLWLCFEEAVPAKAVREWMAKWLDQFRPFPEGVLVELFPKQGSVAQGALGSLIRLPLGRHPETGRPSLFLTPEAERIADPWTTLAQAPRINGATMLQSPPVRVSCVPEPPEAIAPVVRGCALLWALVRKAADTHRLAHTERLALLYTCGHLGEIGQTYLHQVIGLCDNYDSRITQRWIRRVEEGHRPVRCTTLKEWLKDYLPGVTCACTTKGPNASPLDLLRAVKKSSRSGALQEKKDQGWDDVAQDLFGNTGPTVDNADE